MSSSGGGESFPVDRSPRRVPLRTGGGGGGCFLLAGAFDLDFPLDFVFFGGARDSRYNRLSGGGAQDEFLVLVSDHVRSHDLPSNSQYVFPFAS